MRGGDAGVQGVSYMQEGRRGPTDSTLADSVTRTSPLWACQLVSLHGFCQPALPSLVPFDSTQRLRSIAFIFPHTWDPASHTWLEAEAQFPWCPEEVTSFFGKSFWGKATKNTPESDATGAAQHGDPGLQAPRSASQPSF